MRIRRNTLESREHTCTHLYVHITHTKCMFWTLSSAVPSFQCKTQADNFNNWRTRNTVQLQIFMFWSFLQFDTSSCYAQRLGKKWLYKLILEMLIASEDCECPVTEGKYGEPWWRSGQLWHICHCGKRRGEIQQRFKFQNTDDKNEVKVVFGKNSDRPEGEVQEVVEVSLVSKNRCSKFLLKLN